MPERKTCRTLFLAALTFTTLYSLPRPGAAQLKKAEMRAAAARDRATSDTPAALREELQAAAKERGVSIDADLMVYAGAASMLIAVAPIKGIEKYGEAEFAKGAPIHLVLVKSAIKSGLPDGSYVVRAQYRPGADSGVAFFTDRGGAVVARRKLLIRTREQAAALFPDSYGPQAIPVVNSLHYLGINSHGVPTWTLDCSGWIPFRTIWYAVLD
jgi:hypothetical protein